MPDTDCPAGISEEESCMSWLLRVLLLVAVVSVIGWSAESRAGTEGAIKIAGIFSLSGQAEAPNRSVVMGVQIAVDEINASGGILGRRLELLLIDNESTPIGSMVAAQKAVADKVVAIIGASWSSHSLAIAPVAQEHHIPMISPFSSIPKLTAIGNFIFRVCYTDDFQGEMLAKYAFNDLKARRSVIFVDLTSDYSMELARYFREQFQALGGTVEREIEYKSNQINYDLQIARAAAARGDVIVLTGYDESGFIAAKLQQAGIKAKLLGGDGWGEGDFYSLGGNRLHSAYFLTHWTKESENPFSQRFVAEYGKREGLAAGTALGYDAVNVLAEAIRQAGSSDRDDIRQALAKGVYSKGVTGSISFDGQGDPVKNILVVEIRDGVPFYLKTLYPH